MLNTMRKNTGNPGSRKSIITCFAKEKLVSPKNELISQGGMKASFRKSNRDSLYLNDLINHELPRRASRTFLDRSTSIQIHAAIPTIHENALKSEYTSVNKQQSSL